MENIKLVANKLNLNEEDLFCYGNYKAKIENINTNRNGKLILVTSTNPTPYGEGKTTLSIGICDSLNKLGYLSVADLREPSLGPVFGRKGGAVGGGKAIIEPSMDINLHFNGDFHAITSTNNLICAAVDNHIFQGNELKIDKVLIKRCIDMNDRSLRDNFVITPASEIMAILCLSKDIDDLRESFSQESFNNYVNENLDTVYDELINNIKIFKSENNITIPYNNNLVDTVKEMILNNKLSFSYALSLIDMDALRQEMSNVSVDLNFYDEFDKLEDDLEECLNKFFKFNHEELSDFLINKENFILLKDKLRKDI